MYTRACVCMCVFMLKFLSLWWLKVLETNYECLLPVFETFNAIRKYIFNYPVHMVYVSFSPNEFI